MFRGKARRGQYANGCEEAAISRVARKKFRGTKQEALS